jgi:uncharacterized coiled-coil protein SlyX
MKIVRAMKHISRIKGEIKELQKRVSKCLNTIEGNEFSENFSELMKEIEAKRQKLINLKNGVMKANIQGGMFEKILQFCELKSYMDFVRELEPQKGIAESHFRSESTSYISQWSVAEKNKEVERVQAEINRLTDELDDFNAKTDIG